MPRRSRPEPQQSGWITITDMWNARLAYMDCTAGGAQQALEDLTRGFRAAGWEIGERYFDHQPIRRKGVRWEISIVPEDPRLPASRWSTSMSGIGDQASNIRK